MTQPNPVQPPPRRVRDFWIGFLGTILMGGLCIGMSAAFPRDAWSLVFLAAVGLLIVVIGSFVCRRSFIGVGILSAFAIPLLIVGSCFAMATQWR